MSTTEQAVVGQGFSKWWFRKGKVYASFIFLILFALTTLTPFLWMINASMKPLEAVEDLSPIPTIEQQARFVETVALPQADPEYATLSEDEQIAYLFGILDISSIRETISQAFPDMAGSELVDMSTLTASLSSSEQQTLRAHLASTQFSLAQYYWHYLRRNYDDVWNSEDILFQRYYFNSLFIAMWVTLLQCFTSSLAAFAFARLEWPGRDSIFKLYLATMMIPGVVVMIPNYTLMVFLRLLDSYTGLIIPAAFTAFGTFLLRQFMLSIPPSLDEAATIDGASPWRVYWDVILPLARPGLIVLSIFTFMQNYQSFFWPLVLIKSEHLRTLPIGMLYFDTNYGNQTNLIMAASVMNIVPLIILFVLMQKYLVAGIQLGAVKG